MQCQAWTHTPMLRTISQYHKAMPFRHPLVSSTRTFRSSTLRKVETSYDPVTDLTIKASSDVREQTAMLYLDNMFPLRMNVFDIRQWIFRKTRHSLEGTAHKVLPSKEIPHEFAIREIEERTKDGGAIVKFSYKSTDEERKKIAKEIVAKVSESLQKHSRVAPFNLQPLRAFLVKGEPFLEDIVTRYPSTRLRIEFQGEPIGVEKLYKHLRQYGRLHDIALYPTPLVAKDPPRYAIAQFTRIRSATSARNCLHGHVIHGSRLNLLYERQLRPNVVKEWLVSHPRITVPAVAALAAGATYAVFDPIRVFFVTSKITQRFNPEEYALYRWLRSETWARLMPAEGPEHISVWAKDTEHTEKLKSWMRENPETFILVTGPKGSGKSLMVKAAVEDRKYKLFIDCEELANARNKADMAKLLAKEVGYFPIFTWMTSMSSVLETLVTATTGQKAGLSSSHDSQIKDILETLAIALRDIGPKVELERGRQENLVDRMRKWIAGLLDDSHEEVLHEKKKGHQEINHTNVPVVVIENFMYRETAKNASLWNELSEWAAILVENEIAHVVFVSVNPSAPKTLSKALPGKSFSSIMLTDAPVEVSMSFVTKQLHLDTVDERLHDIVSALGGRLTELELLVSKMKMNMDAQVAFEDIIQRNLVEIRKYGFGDALDSEQGGMEWSPIQFWEIIKRLAVSKSINYDELRWTPLFNGDDKPLRAMERAELITILLKDGRPHAIRPGKPVFYTVFNRLVSDTQFAASMEIETNTNLKKLAEQELAKYEEKILSLSQVYNGRPPREIDARIRQLLTKVAKCQKRLEQYEANIEYAKEVVGKDWEDS
ncbi:mitochondrial escape protein 2 [Apophysomyces ossiformis]|uniref:Mitochondrial escape protein 2 n=1 Tax=Apophysomyces ossiformis TaxID=679940 RepID=A0A8H7EQR7_9FUNG|nr:mitochondrial escape protein 2 [Apophysomyces ossiformis]